MKSNSKDDEHCGGHSNLGKKTESVKNVQPVKAGKGDEVVGQPTRTIAEALEKRTSKKNEMDLCVKK